MIKASNLRKALDLLTLLGCRVLRHEEFDDGCEAECNGPYAGYWSKSMVGWNNEHVSFVFELTYNYGVSAYRRGNDLEAVLLHRFNKDGENMEEKLLNEFAEAKDCKGDDSTYRLVDNDFVLRFVDSTAPSEQLIKGLVLNVTDLEESNRFYKKIGFSAVEAEG